MIIIFILMRASIDVQAEIRSPSDALWQRFGGERRAVVCLSSGRAKASAEGAGVAAAGRQAL